MRKTFALLTALAAVATPIATSVAAHAWSLPAELHFKSETSGGHTAAGSLGGVAVGGVGPSAALGDSSGFALGVNTVQPGTMTSATVTGQHASGAATPGAGFGGFALDGAGAGQFYLNRSIDSVDP